MINHNDPRYWNPLTSDWRDGSRFERSILPAHVPGLLGDRTPAAVTATTDAYIAKIEADVLAMRKQREGVKVTRAQVAVVEDRNADPMDRLKAFVAGFTTPRTQVPERVMATFAHSSSPGDPTAW